MPITLRNTDILFNDGTTQSTAAGGAPAYGAVGSYAFFADLTGVNRQAGDSVASTFLYPVAADGATSGTNRPSGTWRTMGYSQNNGGSHRAATVFLRIA